ncbi:DUF1653 domain-containing protein [Patescibacteria group bacterium]
MDGYEKNNPRLGRYQHYKGQYYQVIGLARHSETREELVIYQALDGKQELWARPKKMFLERVMANGQEVPRFKLINKP